MRIVLSLDYEVFFGRQSGSTQETLLDPADALFEIAARHGVPLVLFVDASWLVRLQEEGQRHAALATEHAAVLRQLERFAAAGHELQLHLHPHWLDSHWSGSEWVLDLKRYRLHDFSEAERAEIVREGVRALRAVPGAGAVAAFRAGGWSIQPFEQVREPLHAAGIRIDCTVYPGGHQMGERQRYDFRAAPPLSRWFFDSDPLRPDPNGRFLEVPIASQTVSPAFFWRMAASKLWRSPEQRPFGSGSAAPMRRVDLARKLLRRSVSVVSMDGLKSHLLEAAFQEYWRRRMDDFVVIGHPKAFTRDSLRRLDRFMHAHRGERFVGLDHYLHEFAHRA
jgi:peptidoglycan/xylan/chitin deacetylase (PgdA/CDA1 family)